MKIFYKYAVFFVCFTAVKLFAVDNGKGILPRMGWDAWLQYDGINSGGFPITGWNSTTLSNTAQALCNLGFTNFGYNYIDITAGWQSNRDNLNQPVPAPGVFPGGLPPVISYIHSLGLKAQLYFSCGSNTDFVYTNAWTGSLNYYTNDAIYAATNGFDAAYLDISFFMQTPLAVSTIAGYWYGACSITNTATMYFGMGDGATPTTSASPWWTYCNSWRGMVDNMIPGSPVTMAIITNRFYTNLLSTAGTLNQPGFANDFDFIAIGMTNNSYYGPINLTTAEKHSYFGLWCISASPLILSSSISNLTAADSAILTNLDLISIDQDPLLLCCTNAGTYFVKSLADGSYAVAFLNIGTLTNRVSITFTNLGLPSQTMVHDCWNQADIGVFNGGFAAYVAPHDCLVYKLRNPQVTESFSRTLIASYPTLANNLIGWYDASTIQAQNGATITNWPDSSQNGGTNGLQVFTIDGANPVLNIGAKNGLNVLNFSGLTDNGTGLLATNGNAFTGQFDCFIMFQTTNIANNQSLLGWNNDNASITAIGISGSQHQMWDRGLFFGQRLMDTNWHIFRWSVTQNAPLGNFGGHARNHWFDGILDTNAKVNDNPSSVTNLYIGTDYANHFGNPLGGSIGEIRIYNVILNPTQAKLETAKLGQKWGIKVAP